MAKFLFSSITAKFISGFSALLILLLTITILSNAQISSLSSQVYEKVIEKSDIRSLVQNIMFKSQQINTLVSDFLNLKKPDKKLSKAVEIQDHLVILKEYVKQLKTKNLKTKKEQALLATINNVFTHYLHEIQTTLKKKTNTNSTVPSASLKNTYEQLITEMLLFNNQQTTAMYWAWNSIHDDFSKRKKYMLAASALICLMAYALLFLGLKSIKYPISRLTQILHVYAKGNTNVRADIAVNNEIGFFALQFNKMLDKIEESTQTLNTINEELCQKNAEIKKSEKKYKLLIENIPYRIFYKNTDLVYVACNQHYANDLHIKQKSIAGKTDFDFYPPNLAQKYREDDTRILKSGKVTKQEESWSKDNEMSIVQTIKVPIKDENDNSIGILGIYHDISERKQAEHILQRYHEQLENDVKVRTEELRTTTAQLKKEIKIRKKEERERIQLENDLQLSKKLESIGILAAGIAHEINTPIQFIGDNTQFVSSGITDIMALMANYKKLLVEQNEKPGCPDIAKKVKALEQHCDFDFLGEEIPEALLQIQEGLGRVSKIVNAMRDFSQAGKENKADNDLNKAIENTMTVCHNEWKNTANIQTDFDPELPLVPCFLADINQVVMSLILNAAHAIEEKKLKYPEHIGLISITTRTKNDMAEILVTDNGTGIDPAIRDKIFDPFFTTKDVGKGTGQGLSMAYTTIRQKHAGNLIVDSTQGKGTTFTVRLALKN